METTNNIQKIGTQSRYLQNRIRERYELNKKRPNADLDKQYADTGMILHGEDKSGNLILRKDHRSGDRDQAVFFLVADDSVISKKVSKEPKKTVQEPVVEEPSLEIKLVKMEDLKFNDELFVPMETGTPIDKCFSTDGGVFPGTNYMVVGDPGIGKSTIIMKTASNISTNGKKVLKIETEMTRIDTVGYVKRFPEFASLPTLFVADYGDHDIEEVLEKTLAEGWDLVVIDSVTELVEDLKERGIPTKQAEGIIIDLMVKHNEGNNDSGRYTSFLCIQQINKGGNFVGSNKWKHNTTGMLEFRYEKKTFQPLVKVTKNRRGMAYKTLKFAIKETEIVFREDLALEQLRLEDIMKTAEDASARSNQEFMDEFFKGIEQELVEVGDNEDVDSED